ncbi:MAG: allophanate hydrolase subunit 1 [Candidatus Nanopelagicales bacterium]
MPIEFVSRHSRHPRPANLAESSNDMPNLQAQLHGDTAVFIRCPATDAAAIAQACRQQFPAAIDAWCGDSSVLVQFGEPIKDAARLLRQIQHLEIPATEVRDHRVVTLPVTYDGPDLADVAQESGMSVEAVVARHIGGDYRVAFSGFAPGFAYPTGLDPQLILPRRQSPRAEVAAGSVAIAAQYSAVYPRSSPGGWHILGSCDVEMFNPERSQPALLMPGFTVRFEAR